MKRFLWCSLLLCLYIMARGQTGYEYEYWFDNDRSTLQTGHSATASWQIEADMSQLRETLHTIHVQVRDAEGVASVPVTRFFVKTADRTAAQGRYWFDDDVEHTYVSAQIDGTFDLDVSALSEGFHTLHYQEIGAQGSVSATASRPFYKVYMPAMSSWRCWFDNDYSTLQSGNNLTETILLDVSQLLDGYHVAYIQVDGGADAASTPITRPFLKVPQVIGVDYLTCLFIVDDQLYKQERVSASGGVVAWNLDVSELSQGLHRAYIEVVTPSGAATTAYNTYFIRSATNAELGQMQCVYNIDGGEFQTTAGSISGQDYHFDLDVSALEDGIHRLTYMLNDGNGVSTKVQTQFFTKIPLGGNGITQYEYWLNQNFETRHQVKLPERVDPYNLISLLPVETEPIRSSCFHFEIKDGQPMMYAKNDIYLRFYEATGRFADVAKQFVDYNVEQEVESVGVLQTTQTFPKVNENSVRWYTLEAEPGDTVAFCSSQATSIQLFAPSGDEVYKVSGAESVTYGGCHTWESGTYYLAVHDVTGSQSQMTLDYMHMDKYDVVDWDVHTVGNGGCSTITFRGNGFSELQSVDLILGSDIIQSVEIGHESDAETSVEFDFDGVELGIYDALFHFADEDKEVANCITVEEALPFEFEGTCTFAKQFLISTGNRYAFKVTNKSNMTAYNVPLLIYIYTPDSASLKRVDIEGYDVKAKFKSNIGEYYTDSLNEMITRMEMTSGCLYHFLKQDSTNYIYGHPYLHYAFITPTLGPGMTKTFIVTVSSISDIDVYMCHPIDWEEPEDGPNKIRRKGNVASDAMSGVANRRAEDCAQMQQALEFEIITSDTGSCGDPGDPDNSNSGGGSNATNSLDPNDIYGYLSEASSKFMPDTIQLLNYRIEFENDAEFATASAHVVVVKDTLDSRYFDLASFAPTSIKIGNMEEYLDGSPNFVNTIDMRPTIDAIAQVEGTYDSTKGIATWTFTSLDPMTMEPTDDVMQGFLPVNYDGTSGIGEVSFNIDLKQPLADGTEIPNRAGIVFDQNEAILTPTWTNIVDAVPPTSQVESTTMEKPDTVTLHFKGEDTRSGVWKYTVYIQDGVNAPWREVGVTDTCVYDFAYEEGIDYGFCVLATDSAGNVEQKELAREAELRNFIPGDANGDGVVDTKDAVLVIAFYLGQEGVFLNASAADIVEDGVVDTKDAIAIIDKYLHTSSKTNIKEKKTRKRLRVL